MMPSIDRNSRRSASGSNTPNSVNSETSSQSSELNLPQKKPCNSAVVALINLDSFECQIWKKEFPQVRNPSVVADKSGRIISISPEAKPYNIKIPMRVMEARRQCRLVHVFERPNKYGKSDTTKLRHASWEVLDCINEYIKENNLQLILEVSQIPTQDEIYLDLTQQVSKDIRNNNKNVDKEESNNLFNDKIYLEGYRKCSASNKLQYRLEELYPSNTRKYRDEHRLVIGSIICNEISKYLFNKTGFKPSVGIGHNKLTAKIASQLNSCGSITILPSIGIQRVSKTIEIERLPMMDVELCSKIKKLFDIEMMYELSKYSLEDLNQYFEPEIAIKLFGASHGFCNERVNPNYLPEEISSGKTFPNFLGIRNGKELEKHLQNLSAELFDRIQEEIIRNCRISPAIHISYTCIYRKRTIDKTSFIPFTTADTKDILLAKVMQNILDSGFNELMKITMLKLTAKDFEDVI